MTDRSARPCALDLLPSLRDASGEISPSAIGFLKVVVAASGGRQADAVGRLAAEVRQARPR